MTVILDLPQELEHELSAEAARHGLSLSEYAVQLLAAGRPVRDIPKTGTELVDYWQSEGLIGSRSDIVDSQAHARTLRERAERRVRK